MTRRSSRAFRCLPIVLVFVLGLPAGAGATGAQEAGEAYDYLAVPGRSEPVHEVATTTHRVAMADGVELYVEVTRPVGAGPHPVILELSPYHGDQPTARQGFEDLVAFYAPRGYAVAIADLRGTGRSRGCLDHLGPTDASDGATLVEWLADQPWSTGRVGMIGFSYPAAAAIATAALQPRGLVTIVPMAGLATMYDHQFQAGVAYSGQWAGPVAGYPVLQSIAPQLPTADLILVQSGDNFGGSPESAACAALESSLRSGESQLSGTFTEWFARRDHRTGIIAADLPIFLVHGINDGAARIAASDWFFRRNRTAAGDKLWLHQGDHGPPRADAGRAAVHVWFDHHLQQRPVPTGPPVEVFLADGDRMEDVRFDTTVRTEVFQPDRFPGDVEQLVLSPDPDGGLAATAPAAGAATFVGDARDTGRAGVFLSLLGRADYDELSEDTGHAEWVSAPAVDRELFVGTPELRLSASVLAERVHLIATLYDEAPSGARRRVTTCAINPELREDPTRITPVVPGQRMDLAPPCFAMAHVLPVGHRLVLRTTTSNRDKFAFFGSGAAVTVMTGPGATRIALPLVADPVLLPDTVTLTSG